MTNQENGRTDEQTEAQARRRSRAWFKTWLAIGGTSLVVGGSLGWLGWHELQRRLPAAISEELSGALGRPIRLGELQRFGLTGLRFGETILPPTADDFTWARVEATDISLNPLDLLFRRTFRPSLLLIHPEVAIKQRFDRTWVLNPPDSSVDNEGKIRTEIGSIRVRNADIVVGPVSRQQIVQTPPGFSSTQLIVLENVNQSIQFYGERNHLVAINLGGRLKNGTFRLRGTGDIETGNTNLTLYGRKLRIDTINPFLGGSLFLGEGYGYGNLYIEIRPGQDQPVAIEGALRLQNGQAVITGLPSQFEDIYGRLQFRGQRIAFDDTELRFGPIPVQVQGSVSPQNGFQVGVTVPDVSIEQLETAFAQTLPVEATGRFALLTEVRGPLRTPRITGNVRNLDPIAVDRLAFNQVSATFSGNTQALSLDDLQVLPVTGGSLTASGQIDFEDQWLRARKLPPTALALTANVDLPLSPLADLYGANLPVSLGRLTAVAEIAGPLFEPVGVANWQITDGIAVGGGRLDYADQLATLGDTQLAIANSGSLTATGQADLLAGRLNLNADARLPLDEIAQTAAIALPAGLTLGTLTAQATATGPVFNPVAVADWQLRDGSVPGQGQLTYADQLATIRETTFDVGGSPLQAMGQADLRSGLWQADLLGAGLNLGVVSPLLAGSAAVDISASGRLTELTPAGLQAQGDLAFSAGVPLAIAGADSLLEGPLALSFDWDGQLLSVPTLTAPGLDVSGQVATVLNGDTGWPQPDELDFTVRLTDYDLARVNPLSPIAPYGVLLGGRLDFDGTLRGRLTDPALQGDIALREAALGSLSLLSDVTGTIDASFSGGGRLDLVGDMTTIQAEVGPDQLPISLLFRNGPVLAAVNQEGDWLRGQVRNFPLDALGVRPIQHPDLGVVGGTLRSDFALRRSTLYTNPTGRASFAVNRPALGTFAATSLQGRLRLANGQAILDNTFLTLPQSRFEIAATAQLRSPFSAEASLATTDARLEDLMALLQLTELADLRHLFNPPVLGSAADLTTQPIETATDDFPAQMQQAAAARAQQIEQEAAQARALLPPLSDLAGTVSAEIDIQASAIAGVEMAFDVTGQNWTWGAYALANQFVARGALQDQTLNLTAVRLEAEDAWVEVAGQLAIDGLETQLEVANMDLAPIAQWLDLPLPLQGRINARADLTGTLGNPALLGTFTVDDATLNDYPLLIGSDFSYQDAWFRFDAQVKGEPDEPLLVRGQVPYALPFMTVQPDSEALLVQASLGSGGFALLDLLSPYVAWGGGDASLLIEAKGTLSQPKIVGLIAFQEASITSEFLGETLTELNGSIGFAGDHLQVTGLQGTLLDGQFFLVGELPFLSTTAQTAPPIQPLILNLNRLAFNFADEIASTVEGEVIVSNSVQSPTLGGVIDLASIRVNIGSETLNFATSLLADPGIDAVVATLDRNLTRWQQVPGQFDNFTVRLPDVAEIRVNPLLSVDAIGAISVAGPLTQPVADGSIELLDAWVNTVTTNLFLVKSQRRNLITFDPDRGFDPYIDLVFAGDLPLQRQYDLPTVNDFAIGNNSEIPDLDPLAGLTLFDEIAIEALIEGYVSEGVNLLTLTSSPTYAQDRLISMLTGGYLADLPEGEPALATGANLIFAFFTEQQDALGDALGIRRLRLGASTTLPGDDGDLFGVGMGVSAGITDNFSAELVQIINRNQPYQLNLQYRLNNEVGIGGSTDFSDESRLFMQYRVNF